LDNPDYAIFTDAYIGLQDIETAATAEIQWLNDTIPLVDTMTLEELRTTFKRVMQEQRQEIRAWRYVFRRLRA
jgi:hypothetical protein